MIFRGFRFGLLLQLAVGPVCMLVLSVAASQGFFAGLTAALAVTLVDLIYISLSCLGADVLLRKKKVKSALKYFGAAVLFIFGLSMILSAMNITLLPSLNLFGSFSGGGVFLRAMALTASNPLTIVFWSGVFSSQAADNNYSGKELRLFAVGCVLSTLVFLTAVALLGSFITDILGKNIVTALNIIVGAVIILFGVKLLFRKNKDS